MLDVLKIDDVIEHEHEEAGVVKAITVSFIETGITLQVDENLNFTTDALGAKDDDLLGDYFEDDYLGDMIEQARKDEEFNEAFAKLEANSQ